MFLKTLYAGRAHNLVLILINSKRKHEVNVYIPLCDREENLVNFCVSVSDSLKHSLKDEGADEQF